MCLLHAGHDVNSWLWRHQLRDGPRTSLHGLLHPRSAGQLLPPMFTCRPSCLIMFLVSHMIVLKCFCIRATFYYADQSQTWSETCAYVADLLHASRKPACERVSDKILTVKNKCKLFKMKNINFSLLFFLRVCV